MRASQLVAVVLAFRAAVAGAQEEPPATWDPRAEKAPAERRGVEPEATATATPTATPTPTPTTTTTATATATSVDTATGPPTAVSVASAPEEVPSGEGRTFLPSPTAGSYRWQFMAHAGGASDGAPGFLFGFGIGLGAIRGTRVELNALLGYSSASNDVPLQPTWGDGSTTYTAASWSARAFLFELVGSRRTGAFEVRAGGGMHVSLPQFEATYQEDRCTDILCFGPTYRATDTDELVGSGATGLLLTAGARLAIFERTLIGIDVRWLGPATSHIGDGYGVSVRTGGFAVSTALTVQWGAVVPR